MKMDMPNAFWRPYALPGDAAKEPRASHAIETAKDFAKLSQIIHQTIAVWCGNRGRVTARAVLKLYRKYLRWKEDLSDVLADPNVDTPLAHCFALQ
jgi:hypothetical protein